MESVPPQQVAGQVQETEVGSYAEVPHALAVGRRFELGAWIFPTRLTDGPQGIITSLDAAGRGFGLFLVDGGLLELRAGRLPPQDGGATAAAALVSRARDGRRRRRRPARGAAGRELDSFESAHRLGCVRRGRARPRAVGEPADRRPLRRQDRAAEGRRRGRRARSLMGVPGRLVVGRRSRRLRQRAARAAGEPADASRHRPSMVGLGARLQACPGAVRRDPFPSRRRRRVRLGALVPGRPSARSSRVGSMRSGSRLRN